MTVAAEFRILRYALGLSAASHIAAYKRMKSLKNSGSTDRQNPGTILRCGAESLRTTTNHGVQEPKNKQPA